LKRASSSDLGGAVLVTVVRQGRGDIQQEGAVVEGWRFKSRRGSLGFLGAGLE